MNFADIGKTGILSLRRQNRPIGDLVSYYQSLEPLSADYISSIHVLRICFENNLPYSSKEIKKFCKTIYSPEMGGDPKALGYFMSLQVFTQDCLKFSGKKKIVFLNPSNTSSPKKSPQIYKETNNLQPILEGFSENPIKDTPLGVGGQK